MRRLTPEALEKALNSSHYCSDTKEILENSHEYEVKIDPQTKLFSLVDLKYDRIVGNELSHSEKRRIVYNTMIFDICSARCEMEEDLFVQKVINDMLPMFNGLKEVINYEAKTGRLNREKVTNFLGKSHKLIYVPSEGYPMDIMNKILGDKDNFRIFANYNLDYWNDVKKIEDVSIDDKKITFKPVTAQNSKKRDDKDASAGFKSVGHL